MARKSISKKTRFEVFKRDSFKCQYCGATAPEAVLVVDHIHPVSKDGADDLMNYVTACQPCNAGKSDRLLSDQSAVAKQKNQLDDLQARREQLEMMLQWREGLKEIDSFQIDIASDAWSEAAVGWSLNDKGLKELRALLKKYGLSSVLEAIEKAAESYIRLNSDGKATPESVSLAWPKVAGILRINAMPQEMQRLYYVKGILRKRLNYVPYDVVRQLEGWLKAGVPVEEMVEESKYTKNWNAFLDWLGEAERSING